VGEQSVLDEAANLASMTALEDTELLVIEPEILWQLIDQNNGVARNLLRLLSFRIRAANALLRRRQKLGEFYRQLSLNDGLTGLYNRAWLADRLPELVQRAREDGTPLSVVMIDLDHFKRFNDTHGHIAGDAALCTAAGVIRAALRPSDFAVRYGGEEMMALLPNTGPAAAVMVAARLCARLREAPVLGDGPLSTSLSLPMSPGPSAWPAWNRNRMRAPWSRRRTRPCTAPSRPGATVSRRDDPPKVPRQYLSRGLLCGWS
jgi:diguanylate cyclase (GGDEF)-like protein